MSQRRGQNKWLYDEPVIYISTPQALLRVVAYRSYGAAEKRVGPPCVGLTVKIPPSFFLLFFANGIHSIFRVEAGILLS